LKRELCDAPIALAYLPLKRLHSRLSAHGFKPAAVGHLGQVFRWGQGPTCGKRSECQRTNDDRNPHIPYLGVSDQSRSRNLLFLTLAAADRSAFPRGGMAIPLNEEGGMEAQPVHF